MKKTLLTTLLIAPIVMLAQTTILSDDFDSYTSGNTVATESGGTWETWSGTTPEDAFVSSAQFNSASNSMNVYNTGAGAYLHDMILALPQTYTTGNMEFSCEIYVASGSAGYFNLGGTWNSGGTGYQYGGDFFFNADGTGFMTNPQTNDSTFAYSLDAWNTVSVMIDIDASTFSLSIDGSIVNNGNWGAASGFGAVDIFAVGYSDVSGATEITSNFYIDNVVITDWTGVGIQELNEIKLSVSPNPNNGSFNVNLNEINSGDYNLNIIDVLGNLVYSKNLNIAGKSTLNYDLDLATGMYYINISDGLTTSTQKIIIE